MRQLCVWCFAMTGELRIVSTLPRHADSCRQNLNKQLWVPFLGSFATFAFFASLRWV